MSLVTPRGPFAEKRFAMVPSLLDQPAIQEPSPTPLNVSSFRGRHGGVDLAEGCLITKTVRHTHSLDQCYSKW